MTRSVLLNNATLAATTSWIFRSNDATQVQIFWTLTGISGTPSVQFKIEPIDPTNESTVIGSAVSSAVISAIGSGTLMHRFCKSPVVKITATITGVTSFTGVTILAAGNTQPKDLPLFSVFAPSVSAAASKSMLSLFNASTSLDKVRVHQIYIVNVQQTNIASNFINFELHKTTAQSAGTTVTPIAYDSQVTLDSGVTSVTGGTITELAAMDKFLSRAEELATSGANTVQDNQQINSQTTPWYNSNQGIVCNPGEGLHVKASTGSPTGIYNLKFVFSIE